MEFFILTFGLPIICQSTSPLQDGVNQKSVTRTLVANEWNSFDIPLSEFTSQGLPLNNVGQFMFVGTPSAAGTVLLITFIFIKRQLLLD
jgi:hypothetical protein